MQLWFQISPHMMVNSYTKNTSTDKHTTLVDEATTCGQNSFTLLVTIGNLGVFSYHKSLVIPLSFYLLGTGMHFLSTPMTSNFNLTWLTTLCTDSMMNNKCGPSSKKESVDAIQNTTTHLFQQHNFLSHSYLSMYNLKGTSLFCYAIPSDRSVRQPITNLPKLQTTYPKLSKPSLNFFPQVSKEFVGMLFFHPMTGYTSQVQPLMVSW